MRWPARKSSFFLYERPWTAMVAPAVKKQIPINDHMLRTSLMIVIFIGVTCLLFGCVGPTRITSEPSDVPIFLNGTLIGTTPFSYNVRDIFGMNSTYGFTAEKAGYRPDTNIFREKGFDGAKETIPPHIHFVLRLISGERPTKQQADENALPLTQLPQLVEPF